MIIRSYRIESRKDLLFPNVLLVVWNEIKTIIWETTRTLETVLILPFATLHKPFLCSNKHPANEEYEFLYLEYIIKFISLFQCFI